MATQATNPSTVGDDRFGELIESVPGDRRTEARDEVAREILEWQSRGEWPLSGPEMEARGEYSAQHYRHTLALYRLNRDIDDVDGGGEREVTITVPRGLDAEAYARGYLDGYIEARE